MLTSIFFLSHDQIVEGKGGGLFFSRQSTNLHEFNYFCTSNVLSKDSFIAKCLILMKRKMFQLVIDENPMVETQ